MKAGRSQTSHTQAGWSVRDAVAGICRSGLLAASAYAFAAFAAAATAGKV
jgi:hypothetical protein